MTNKYLAKQFISTFQPPLNCKNKTILYNDKRDIQKQLSQHIASRNTKEAMKTAVELVISGNTEKVIQDIILYYFNEINIGCVQAIPFIGNFMKYYSMYDYKLKKQHPIVLVNDQVIRNFVCFFITLITISRQNKIAKLPKIDVDDFDLKKHRSKIISTNLTLVNRFIQKEDPNEIVIPLSEICTLLSNSNIPDREIKCIYWLSWIMQYEKSNHKNNLIVAARNIQGVDLKYRYDFIWIIWNILLSFTNDYNREYIQTLFELFKIGYTRGTKKSRANIIIMAILMIINPFPKITYPVEPMDTEQYSNCITNSLKCNLYFLKIFQHATIGNST
jgi:hypothetical protein